MIIGLCQVPRGFKRAIDYKTHHTVLVKQSFHFFLLFFIFCFCSLLGSHKYKNIIIRQLNIHISKRTQSNTLRQAQSQRPTKQRCSTNLNRFDQGLIVDPLLHVSRRRIRKTPRHQDTPAIINDTSSNKLIHDL